MKPKAAIRSTQDRPPGQAECLEEVLDLSVDLLPQSAQRELRAGIERLRQGRFNLVVLGEFKRGKSSLINALIGRPLLPTGVLPLTSVVTILRGGPEERLLVRFEDGRREREPRGGRSRQPPRHA